MKKVLLISTAIFLLSACTRLSPTTPEATPTVVIQTPSAQVNELLQGGSSYRDPEGLFTLLYPNDYTLDTADAQHPRIYKRGPSSRPQGELNNGALIVFERINLNGKTLEAFVEEKVSQSLADGSSTIVSPKKSIVVNGANGFTFSLHGLGEPVTTILSKPGSTDALLITTMVEDPQKVGYQQQVDAVLSSVQLLH